MTETEVMALLAAGGTLAGGAAAKKRSLSRLWRRARHGKRAARHVEATLRRRPGESDEDFAYRKRIEAQNFVRRGMR